MKKLLYLFVALATLGCSKDDSTEPQTFFEKYDGVVWEEEESFPDYVYRLQFNNETQPSITYYGQEEGFADCDTELIENTGELTQVNENSFVLYIEYFEGELDYSYTITVTATEGGSKLTIVDSDIPDQPDVYNRTSLNEPCQ